MDSKFVEFIQNILSSVLNKKTIEKYLTPNTIEKFKTGFVHKSIKQSATENYELAEFEGDVYVNSIVTKHIRRRFPEIINVDWITKIKQRQISKFKLAEVANNLGFLKWIKIHKAWIDFYVDISKGTLKQTGDNTIDWVKTSGEYHDFLMSYEEFISILEDTFEAFIGNLVAVVDDYHKITGPGFGVAFLLFDDILSKINISIKYEDVFDPKTRLIQTVLEPKPVNRWGKKISELIVSVQIPMRDGTLMWKTTIYGYGIKYPNGLVKSIDLSNPPVNGRIIIAESQTRLKNGINGSEALACAKAIAILTSVGRIQENIKDPREMIYREPRIPTYIQ